MFSIAVASLARALRPLKTFHAGVRAKMERALNSTKVFHAKILTKTTNFDEL